MIKELITDISYDKITLSQALTRAKLLANKLNNETLRQWLKKEIEGYNHDDPLLPKYRKILSGMYLVAKFSGGEESKFPLNTENLPKDIVDSINFHQIKEPTQIIEFQLKENDKPLNGRVKLPSQLVEMAKGTLPKPILMQINMVGGVIDTLEREVNTANLHNVINQTKNILLDILLELEKEFPNIENDYTMNNENEKKTDTIITTNIYGNNSPVNIVNGENIKQNNSIKIKKLNFEKLKSLNVEEKEIKELEQIITECNGNKNNFATKAIGWLGKVTASLSAKGLYENIPTITEYIQTLI